MKKLTLIISLIWASTFLVGCDKSNEDTKVEPRKNIMGNGDIKIDPKRETGGI